HQQFYRFFCSGSDYRISAYTDGGCYSKTRFYYLVCRFVSEGTRLRNDSDSAWRKYESWHNAHLSLPGSYNTWTVRTYQSAPFALNELTRLHHILHGNALSNTNNNFYTGICSLHDGICCKRWGYKYD